MTNTCVTFQSICEMRENIYTHRYITYISSKYVQIGIYMYERNRRFPSDSTTIFIQATTMIMLSQDRSAYLFYIDSKKKRKQKMAAVDIIATLSKVIRKVPLMVFFHNNTIVIHPDFGWASSSMIDDSDDLSRSASVSVSLSLPPCRRCLTRQTESMVGWVGCLVVEGGGGGVFSAVADLFLNVSESCPHHKKKKMIMMKIVSIPQRSQEDRDNVADFAAR